MKRNLMITAAVIICLALAAAVGTLSYNVVEKTIDGNVSMSGLDFILHETDAKGEEVDPDTVLFKFGEDLEGYIPGASRTLNVFCENVRDEPMFIRVKLGAEVNSMKGMVIPEDEMKLAKDKVDSVLEFNFNTENWQYKNGYFYYKDVLAPGKQTEPLFTTMTFNAANMANEFRGTAISLTIDADAVQSKNNGTSALTAAGWAA